jgi:hypothetical protein
MTNNNESKGTSSSTSSTPVLELLLKATLSVLKWTFFWTAILVVGSLINPLFIPWIIFLIITAIPLLGIFLVIFLCVGATTLLLGLIFKPIQQQQSEKPKKG